MHADWMSKLSRQLLDTPLRGVAIPGSHDSASYSLNATNGLAPGIPDKVCSYYSYFIVIFCVQAQKCPYSLYALFWEIGYHFPCKNCFCFIKTIKKHLWQCSTQGPRSVLNVEGLIEPRWWSREILRKFI